MFFKLFLDPLGPWGDLRGLMGLRGPQRSFAATFHKTSSILKLGKVRTLKPHGMLKLDRRAHFTI